MSEMVRIVHPAVMRGRSHVLSPCDLELPVGSTVGLVGANGAGKSTWMMCLVGALRYRFSATIEGLHSKHVAYLPQRPAFAPWLTAEEALASLGLDFEQLLERYSDFKLEGLAQKVVSKLSPGQQQILGALGALELGCPLTLLDEPLSALDIGRRRRLIKAIQSRDVDQSLTIISSQIPSDLQEMCDYFLVLREGTWVFSGTMHALLGEGEPSESDSFEIRVLDLIEGS